MVVIFLMRIEAIARPTGLALLVGRSGSSSSVPW